MSEIPAMAAVLAAPDAARLTDFARAFKAAARAVVLYPDAHPAITTTLARLTQITTPPHLDAPIRIGVSAGALLIDGASPARPDPALNELAVLLHSHLIGEMVVHPDGNEAAWRRFLLLLARAPDGVRADGGIARVWNGTTRQHVVLREIDYREVLRERSGGRAASWEALVRSCLTGDAMPVPEELVASLVEGRADGESIAALVADVDQSVKAEGGGIADRAAALIRLLRAIVEEVGNRAPGRTDEVMRELATAMGRLSPDLMLSILSGAQRPALAGSVVEPVVRQMSDGAIAGFVARSALDGGTPVERIAQAFQALVLENDRRERLVTMAHDTAVVAGAEGAAFEESWQQVAQKLLTQYSDEPFVSRWYARELSSARAQAVHIDQMQDDPPERVQTWLATVATSEMRRLDLLLILDLLQIEQDADRRSALMTPVLALMDDLFLVGDFEAAETVLAIIDADRRDADRPERQAIANAAVARIINPTTLRHVVGHLGTIDEQQFQRVKRMCLLLGHGLVRPLADALSQEERTRTRERLTDLLVGFDSIGRNEVDQLKASLNPAVRRTAVYLLRELGGESALPELEELMNDIEPAVQREAVRAILTLGSDRANRVLQQALLGGNARAREAVMQTLASHRDDRVVPLLVYVLDHVRHTGELRWVYARALELLGQLRAAGTVPAIRAALYRGAWWAPRRTAALRRSAAAALARAGTAEALAALEEAAHHGSRGVRAAAQAELDLLSRDRTRGLS